MGGEGGGRAYIYIYIIIYLQFHYRTVLCSCNEAAQACHEDPIDFQRHKADLAHIRNTAWTVRYVKTCQKLSKNIKKSC